MTTNATVHRRRQMANTNPAFLQVALRQYRRDGPERHIVINTRTIQQVSPPGQTRETNLATGKVKVYVSDPRYMVNFKVSHGNQEYGRATRADLVAACIPIPPGWS